MKTFIASLTVVVLGGLFTWWLSQERYDLRFTVSDPIPVRFGGAQDEAVQQIEVKNVGHKPVEQVRVAVPPPVIAHEIIQNSLADKVVVFTNNNSLEAVYPVLPPQGTFRLIIKAPTPGIMRERVQVKHSRGDAQYALASQSSVLSTSVLLNGGLAIFYLCLVLAGFRNLFINHLESDVRDSPERVLRKSKPFYVKSERWPELRNAAVNNLVAKNRPDFNVLDSQLIKWLDRDKLEYLSNEEWDRFTAQAVKAITADIEQAANAIDYEETYSTLLRIKKPLHFPAEKWDTLRGRLQKGFFRRRAETFGSAKAKLIQPKPEGVDEAMWRDDQNKWTKRYAGELLDQVMLSLRPANEFQKQDLSPLPNDLAEGLRKQVYRICLSTLPNMNFERYADQFVKEEKPTWMTDADYSALNDTAKRTLRVAKEDADNRVILRNLRFILAGSAPDLKELEQLDAEVRQSIIKLDENIRAEGRRLSQVTKDFAKETKEFAPLKEKVLKQLSVLEKLFADPSSIARIEDYDNPFSSGNFELLKRLAQLARNSGG